MAGSFHVVILPEKMFARTVPSSLRLLTFGRLYVTAIGPIRIG